MDPVQWLEKNSGRCLWIVFLDNIIYLFIELTQTDISPKMDVRPMGRGIRPTRGVSLPVYHAGLKSPDHSESKVCVAGDSDHTLHLNIFAIQSEYFSHRIFISEISFRCLVSEDNRGQIRKGSFRVSL